MADYVKIDYGSGIAELWGDFNRDSAIRIFMRHANQCFGIRKSIMRTHIVMYHTDAVLPPEAEGYDDAHTVLIHSRPCKDVIIWNVVGEKIKSEWD